MPTQLAEEVETLRRQGQPVTVIEDGARYLLVLESFVLPNDRYVPAVTDVMVMADYQYPMSRLDMYWTAPEVRLVSGAFPQGADQFEDHGGRRWQRWSWHYPTWNPGHHNLHTHLEVFYDRLAKGV